MSKLAMLGGKPVTKDFTAGRKLPLRPDLERKYLLEVHTSENWDDWPDEKTMASRFASEWARFSGAKFCNLLTNGTHTLQVALETLDIGHGDEVIVPGLTWQATASVVCDVNAVPILVDVDPRTFCIDPAKIEAAITSRTRAIIPVHLYHRLADMTRIMKIARKHKLFVIEDCAHAHGSQWQGRGVGSIGDLGSFSFQRSKLLNSAEGGALLSNRAEYYYKIESQRMCGREMHGYKAHSGNYRMTCFQAAILRGQLAALKVNAPQINRVGLAMDKAIAAAPGVQPLFRDACIARQCGYAFAFAYDKAAYDGLPGETFRQALSAELGWGFGTTYTPLNHSEVYYPHTKKRHHLSKEYLKAITPSRWKLPVCEDLWRDRAITASWSIFAVDPKRAGLLSDAIAKIYENRAELLRAKKLV